jgi:hypothetical protein
MIYWHFFTITVYYNSSEWITTPVWQMLTEESLATEISWTELTSMRTEYRSPPRTVSCYSVLSVAVETSEPLPSKWTSTSAAILAFRQCLLSCCLVMDYSVTLSCHQWSRIFEHSGRWATCLPVPVSFTQQSHQTFSVSCSSLFLFWNLFCF